MGISRQAYYKRCRSEERRCSQAETVTALVSACGAISGLCAATASPPTLMPASRIDSRIYRLSPALPVGTLAGPLHCNEPDEEHDS